MSLRILVIDDNPHDRMLARRELTKRIPEVVIREAYDPESVQQAFEAGDFDIIVTDYQLRWTTGTEILQEAKRRFPDVAVVMFTHSGSEEIALEALKSGLDDYVIKTSYDSWRLSKAVRRVVELNEARQVEERLRQEQARNQAKDDFLVMLAHELRGPLAPMSAALYLLKMAPDEETQQAAVATLDRQVHHMAQLVNDLLDVSRIVRGRLVLEMETLDLQALLQELVKDRHAEFQAAGVRLETSWPARPVWVHGDRTRLIQVFSNLVDNALKFTDVGKSVHLELDSEARAVVRDEGIGIPPELLRRIFESFVQADSSLARTRGGLGMGLAVVKGLVELHGGRIEVFSEGSGRGATFTVTLKPAEAPAAAGPEEEEASLTPSSEKPSILIIEDHPDTVDMLQRLLRSEGYAPVTACSGPEGVKLARLHRPRVVLCDIGLPEMNGFEVAQALRAQPETAGAYLVAMTGYGQEQDRRNALAAGFDRHLVKPVKPPDLLQMLGSVP